MVYCGRPSSACEACRVKKTKCDADPRGCKQCKFVGRVCPGYRSPLDIVFRDETAKLLRKAAKIAQKSAAKQDSLRTKHPPVSTPASKQPRAVVTVSKGAPHVATQVTPSLQQSLTPCLNERAKCYFVSNFADGIIFAADEDFAQTTYPFLERELEPTLNASFEAVSLLSLANHTQDLELHRRSQRQYVEAIKEINAAIASSTAAVKDATLLSVNFLGLFEVLSGRTKLSMRSWADHCNGAGALLKLRGDEQFHTPAGCRLFRQIRASLINGCLQWTMRIPEHIIEMSSSYAKTVELTGWRLRLFEAGPAVSQFRYDIRRGITTDLLEILKGGLRIDEPLAALCSTPPTELRFDTIARENMDPEFVPKDELHIYPKVWIAGSWNTIRSLRILIHMEIYHALRKAAASSPNVPQVMRTACQEQLRKSMEICQKMQADIISSAPQLMGYIVTHPAPMPRSAFILVWAIWIAGAMSTASPESREYCTQVLDDAGLKIGHSHALRFASLLKTESVPVVWGRHPDYSDD